MNRTAFSEPTLIKLASGFEAVARAVPANVQRKCDDGEYVWNHAGTSTQGECTAEKAAAS